MRSGDTRRYKTQGKSSIGFPCLFRENAPPPHGFSMLSTLTVQGKAPRRDTSLTVQCNHARHMVHTMASAVLSTNKQKLHHILNIPTKVTLLTSFFNEIDSEVLYRLLLVKWGEEVWLIQLVPTQNITSVKNGKLSYFFI